MKQQTPSALSRLLQLASPALPVGAYSYSQGLESAVDAGLVKNEQGASHWIADLLENPVGQCEAPLLAAMMRAWSAGDEGRVGELNDIFVATRETSELRAETLQMGYSLRGLLEALEAFPRESLDRLKRISEPTYPAAFGFAAAGLGIPIRDALVAYLWSWAENQVMAALKVVPLGQTAGQRILYSLGARLDDIAARAETLDIQEMSSLAPMLAIQSSRHEIQYSRLFRS